uniref:Protocadherin 10 n=1 Tax=Serinus canaria TaxID=9135 RepID=A0A8C9MMX4_SERCA
MAEWLGLLGIPREPQSWLVPAPPAMGRDVLHLNGLLQAPSSLQPVYTVSLPENSPPGTLVLQLNATDPDEGQNGEIIYSFSSHISARARELFGIAPRTGRLEVSGELDYEESSVYQVYVQAKDLGPNAVPVRVSDVNDNAPRFSQPVYQVYVSENNVPGAYIYAVSATDRDQGANARLAYSILESQIQGMSVFTYVSINSENGFLYALRSFDYEQLKEFRWAGHLGGSRAAGRSGGGWGGMQRHVWPCDGGRMFYELLFHVYSNVKMFLCLVLHSRKQT